MIAPLLILASATFFADHCRAANGHTPAANKRRYGLCAAYARGVTKALQLGGVDR